MKLSIKKKYFDEIKAGKKKIDFRDAHITFVCEETGEKLIKNVKSCAVILRPNDFYPDVLSDNKIIAFELVE
jgi:ASC-1-like (ASCH) protein